MLSKLITVTIGISMLVLLFTFLPFTVSIPGNLLAFFTGNSVKEFFSSLYYFLPMNYIFACIIVIFTAKYFKIFIKLITWIYDKIFR